MENTGYINIDANFVIAISTVIYTIGTFLLWISTRKSTLAISKQVELSIKQIESQLAIGFSNFKSQNIDRHREIFQEILRSNDLLELFSNESGVPVDQLRKNILASILINHSSSIYHSYVSVGASKSQMSAFKNDIKDLYSLSFVSDRWALVKVYHPEEFVSFIEESIINITESS